MEKEYLLDNITRLNQKYNEIHEMNSDLDICKSEYNQALKKYGEIKEEMGTATFLKAGLFYLLCVLSIIILIGSIVDYEDLALVLLALCLVIFFGALGMLIQTYSYAKHDRRKNEIRANQYWVETVIPLKEELDSCQKKLIFMLDEYENDKFYKIIPDIYRNKDAYEYFLMVLKNRRADTEKEMYNLYEEELHRRKTLEIEEKKLEELQQIGVRCPKCNSGDCQLIVETDTDSTPFSFLQACCGRVLLGPIGLLCGFCGTGTEVKTTTYYKCNSCGIKFNK